MPESGSLNWMEIIKVGITDFKGNSKMKTSVNKTDILSSWIIFDFSSKILTLMWF